jgi:HlyD family secretion protein
MANPARNENAINMLLLAAAAAVAIAYVVPRYAGSANAVLTSFGSAQATPAQASVILAQASTTPAPQQKAPPTLPAPLWAAAGQGRVEPYGGEVRITAQAQGRIVEVLAAVNDKVQAGELLVRLDDADPEARVGAAEAEASVRRRERNAENVTGIARDRRAADDAIASAERALTAARAEYDRQIRLRRSGKGTAADQTKARDAVNTARDLLDTNRANLRRIMAAGNVPEQTRLEASIAASRSDISLAEALLERTRIRAPKDGTILQVIATVGETAVPTPDQVMIVLGDMSKLRVRAELEERDSGKVRVGQAVVVRSDAFPGKDFEGKVGQIAQALAPSKIGLKGPRRGLEVDVLEVLVDLDGLPALLPGMRVDVLLKPDATAEAPKDAPKQN